MSDLSQIDQLLRQWGERVFNTGPVKKVPERHGMTGLRLVGPSGSKNSGGAGSANAVRQKLQGIIKRTPQVMVRISGGGKSVGHIKAHLDYISRNGQIALEDQLGDKFQGKDELEGLRDEWKEGGFPINDSAGIRQAFNIILSMPAGTDERSLLYAVRGFAASEFANYQYVFALHTQDTDPDASPSPNPHVHLCVKATSLDGTRLNPRKDELQRWRERFAEHLREHGIEAEATRRIHRMQKTRGEKQSIRHMKARGERLRSLGQGEPSAVRAGRARGQEAAVREGYRALASTLASSTDPRDRALGHGLHARFSDREKDGNAHPSPSPDR